MDSRDFLLVFKNASPVTADSSQLYLPAEMNYIRKWNVQGKGNKKEPLDMFSGSEISYYFTVHRYATPTPLLVPDFILYVA